MSLLSGFARDSVIRVLSFAAAVLLALFVTPRILDAVGKEAYGGWVLVSTTILYYQLLEGGVMQAVSRYAAAAYAKNDLHEVDRVCTAGRCCILDPV